MTANRPSITIVRRVHACRAEAGVSALETALPPFTVVKGAKIEGGHYMPVISYDKNWVYLVTWGKVVQATYGWVNKYMDESIAYLSVEMLKNGKSFEGFDLITLQKDIAAI